MVSCVFEEFLRDFWKSFAILQTEPTFFAFRGVFCKSVRPTLSGDSSSDRFGSHGSSKGWRRKHWRRSTSRLHIPQASTTGSEVGTFVDGDNEKREPLFSCTFGPIRGRDSLSCFITSSRRLCCNFWFGSRFSRDIIRHLRVSRFSVRRPPKPIRPSRSDARDFRVQIGRRSFRRPPGWRSALRSAPPREMPRQWRRDKRITVDTPGHILSSRIPGSRLCALAEPECPPPPTPIFMHT